MKYHQWDKKPFASFELSSRMAFRLDKIFSPYPTPVAHPLLFGVFFCPNHSANSAHPRVMCDFVDICSESDNPELLSTKTEGEGEGDAVARYNKISEMPNYTRPIIIKMVDGGFISGADIKKDENNRPADLDLSIDMIWVFVANDRAGLYDKKP